jgi:hypothetical protein
LFKFREDYSFSEAAFWHCFVAKRGVYNQTSAKGLLREVPTGNYQYGTGSSLSSAIHPTTEVQFSYWENSIYHKMHFIEARSNETSSGIILGEGGR